MKIVSPSFEIITPIDSAEILKMIEEVGRTCYKSEDRQDVYNYAMDMLEREGKQAAQGLYHNLNTLESRQGSQVPFTSINLGRDTSTEGRLVTKWIMEASILMANFVLLLVGVTL